VIYCFVHARIGTHQEGDGFDFCGVRFVHIALAQLETRAGSTLGPGVGVVAAIGRQDRSTAGPADRLAQHDGQAAGRRPGQGLARNVDEVAVVVHRGVWPIWRAEAYGKVVVGLDAWVEEK
jgi:hypothetical protein